MLVYVYVGVGVEMYEYEIICSFVIKCVIVLLCDSFVCNARIQEINLTFVTPQTWVRIPALYSSDEEHGVDIY